MRFSSTILLLFLSFPILAQDAVTKLLGKFGAADLSIRKEVDGGRELAYLNVTFQNAESPADAIDIGGLMLTDSAAATNFADHLSDALGHLAARRGRKEFEGRTYVISAKAGDNRVILSGKGVFKSKYTDLTELQASRLADAVRRSVVLIRD
jgi:hypothetical protein